MYFDFDQGFLDVYSDVLLKLILMIFLTGKVTFPSGGIGGRGDSWVLNY